MFVRWRSTVFSLITRSPAISREGRASAISLTISTSRGVSGSSGGVSPRRARSTKSRISARTAPGERNGSPAPPAPAARVEERLAAHRRPAGLDEVAIGDALEHVAGRARAQRLEQVLLVVVHREDQHAQVVAARCELARGLQPGHAR